MAGTTRNPKGEVRDVRIFRLSDRQFATIFVFLLVGIFFLVDLAGVRLAFARSESASEQALAIA